MGPAMDIEAIQTALIDWVKAVTSLPAAWENKVAPIQAKLPARIVLTGPLNIEPVGEDYVQWADAAAGLESQPTVVGHREFDVMVRVISRSQAGNKTANFYLEKLRAAWRRPSSDDYFRDAGIAIIDMSKSTSFDAPFEERWESIASATWRLTAVILDADDATVPTLTSVSLTSRIEDESGTVLPTPPNVTDELITVE